MLQVSSTAGRLARHEVLALQRVAAAERQLLAVQALHAQLMDKPQRSATEHPRTVSVLQRARATEHWRLRLDATTGSWQ